MATQAEARAMAQRMANETDLKPFVDRVRVLSPGLVLRGDYPAEGDIFAVLSNDLRKVLWPFKFRGADVRSASLGVALEILNSGLEVIEAIKPNGDDC